MNGHASISLDIQTPSGGFKLPLGSHPLTIGRAADNQIHFDDKLLDDYHCVLLLSGHAVHVIDRNTASGTHINGSPISHGTLKSGDVLRAGSVQIKLAAAVEHHRPPAEPGESPSLRFNSPPGAADRDAPGMHHPEMPVIGASKLRYAVTGKDDSGAPIKVIPDADLDRPPITSTPRLLGELLLPREMDSHIRHFLRRHAGAMIICGPSGCGKSTTAYALLRLLSAGKRKITTFEQPPEFPIESATQIFIHHRREYTPAVDRALRSRQNVLFLGEPPPAETAARTLRSAVGRCLAIIISQAEDSAHALRDMLAAGVPPKHLASGLSLIVSQRLVRRLCDQCKTPIDIPAEHRARLAPFLPHIQQIYIPDACPVCNNTGYVGRIGVFEFTQMTDALRAALLDRPDLDLIDNAMQDPKSHIPLTLSAYARVAQGFTAMNEAIALVQTLRPDPQED